MAKRKRNKKDDETLVDLVEARQSAQSFIEDNQLYIFGGLVALVLLVGGVFAWKNFYKAPKQKEAVQAMWKAEQMFERDSFATALTNPGGGYDGLVSLVDNYGGMDAGNAANFYTGLSYLHTGQFDAAISYLNSVKASGQILPIVKFGALGDAHSEKGEFDKAISNYQKAIKNGDNEALTPVYLKRLGMLYEKQGKAADARKQYQQVKDQYPNSGEARDIEKYLIRLEGK
jgi:tetratricopeptide (TPR) repeat protein